MIDIVWNIWKNVGEDRNVRLKVA